LEIKRVAIISGVSEQSIAIAARCRDALASLLEGRLVAATELPGLASNEFDLYFKIGNTPGEAWPPALRPAVWWLVDGRASINGCIQNAGNFDRVFAARQSVARMLADSGVDAEWLPAACGRGASNNDLFRREFDLCLIGQPSDRGQGSLIELVRSHFRDVRLPSADAVRSARDCAECLIAASSDRDSWTGFDGFEAMAAGALLLVDRAEASDQMGSARDGVHYVSYQGPHELLDHITFYLKRSDLRQRIADAGRRHAMVHCDFLSRMRQLLENCAAVAGTRAVAGLPPPVHLYDEGRRPTIDLPLEDAPAAPILTSTADENPWLAIVPPDAARILDLECGDGGLGRQLQEQFGAAVTGITQDERQAVLASDRLDKVLVGHPLGMLDELSPASFDCILLRRWLARVENPAELLRKAQSLLRPGGCAIAEIDNAGHYRRIASLINGDWTYGTSGVIEAGSWNLFTRRIAEQWFAASGWDVFQTVRSSEDDGTDSGIKPKGVHTAGLAASGLFEPGTPCDPLALGYLMRAAPRGRRPEPTTIIVTSPSRSPNLRPLVRSIMNATPADEFELIFVDTGWDQDSKLYLQAIEELLPVQVAVMPAGTIFSDAIAEGVRRCRGSMVLLLSPEMRASPGWLGRLLASIDSDPQVMCVGPRVGRAVDEPAATVRADHYAAQRSWVWESAAELSCACLLFRREVIADIEWIYPQGDGGALAVARLSKAETGRGNKALIATDVFVRSMPPYGIAAGQWREMLTSTSQWFDEGVSDVERDVINEVTLPRAARRVLNLGSLGASIHPLPARNLAAAMESELDRVESSAHAGSDCIILEESLSSVPDPVKLLRRVRGLLTPGGVVRARFANMSYSGSIGALIEGRAPGIDARSGMTKLCLSPLRNFTPREVEKLFHRSGFTIRSLEAVAEASSTFDDSLVSDRNKQGDIACGPLRISGLTAGEAERFRSEAYLVEAIPSPVIDYGLTSILIKCGADAGVTRRCVDSIRQRTDDPFELIALIEGRCKDSPISSDDEIAAIIAEPEESARSVRCRGISRCSGRQIVILRDHVTVTTGWLSRMLRALCSDSSIAVVGPCSDAGDAAQRAPAAPDATLLDGFAWEWGKAHDRVIEDSACVMPSCFLFRRADVAQALSSDFEANVAGMVSAGRRCVIARDSYCAASAEKVIGTPSHAAVAHESAAIPDRNMCKERLTWRAISEGSELVLARERLDLSLCMIVRDSARTLGACLRSIRPWVSEMIVVDTGSLDGTPELARTLGARVFHFPWCCDFAAARNESLRHAIGRWVFWMDADDTIDSISGRRLRELAQKPAPSTLLGYVMQVHCPGGGKTRDVTVVDHVKLFRNRADLRFQGRIHEQILPAIRRAGGEVSWTDIFVTHSGADYSVAGRRRKFARDMRLLELELRDRPNNSFTLFNLGMTHGDVGEHSAAVDYLRRSLAASERGESHVRKIYALLAASLSHLSRHQEAYETCRKGLHLFAFDTELNFRAAIASHRLGNLSEAERLYMRVLAGGDARHFSSVDRGIAGFKAHYNLAGVYLEMGRLDDAEARYVCVTEMAPYWVDGWRALANFHVERGRFHDAEQVRQRLSEMPSLSDLASELDRRLLRARRAAGPTRELQGATSPTGSAGDDRG
jgi:glycosyltransferase involved in cell wall biosynthesis/SAM-dependent methyltransferase